MTLTIRGLQFTAAILIMSTIWACFPAFLKRSEAPEQALQPVGFFFPTFADDLERQSLILAVERSLQYLETLPEDSVFDYGPDRFTKKEVQQSHTFFISLLKDYGDPKALDAAVRRHFRVYKAAGREGSRKVLFTGYFEPLYPASLKPDQTYSHPIYSRPDDLAQIDLGLFRPQLKGESIVARLDGQRVVPYYTRRQIDREGALAGRGLELAWLKDPLDTAFLQIQGSGRLQLPGGGTLAVGYAAANGHPYRAIGRYLIDHGYLSAEEMSMQRIRRCLTDRPELLPTVLDFNAAYVFFKHEPRGPLGSLGVTLVPGRSLAADHKLFPKGALAFITCRKPQVDSNAAGLKWKDFTRFMLIHDTGGAIKGAGRADIFWGTGPYAELAAGHLRHEGELYVLIKKKEGAGGERPPAPPSEIGGPISHRR